MLRMSFLKRTFVHNKCQNKSFIHLGLIKLDVAWFMLQYFFRWFPSSCSASPRMVIFSVEAGDLRTALDSTKTPTVTMTLCSYSWDRQKWQLRDATCVGRGHDSLMECLLGDPGCFLCWYIFCRKMCWRETSRCLGKKWLVTYRFENATETHWRKCRTRNPWTERLSKALNCKWVPQMSHMSESTLAEIC